MVKISILADNRVATLEPKGLRGEWGFAAAVGDVLFDTGQTGVVPENAARMGLDFDFETIVLSHSHYDHAGGLTDAIGRLNDPTLYCHPSVWTPRQLDHNGRRREIGLPYARETVADKATIVEHTDPVEIAEDVYALGEIPRPNPDAAIGMVESDGTLEEDPIYDDQALVVDRDSGLALVLGCGHAGLQNTIEYAESEFGKDVRAVVGGTHLIAFDDEAIHRIADDLEGQLELFAGTHCTGADAERIFARRFPEAFRSVGVGSTLEV